MANQSKPKPTGAGRRVSKTKTLREEVEAAVRSATWITPADQATVALARRLASELEAEIDPRLGALLVNVLSSLGLTVAGRGAKPQEPEREVNPLDELRTRAATRHTNAKVGNPTPEPAK